MPSTMPPVGDDYLHRFVDIEGKIIIIYISICHYLAMLFVHIYA